ncbi:undecaprenyl-phosphate 4-deoxy-4-formamido-L-arabinose transferase [Lachnospiraceae bacterium XBD2001]|nr:undecaprenyl-phosphate 4-deoxy-4-formamido-L-arabinose transferase [Lachnospiraceae bacterium XBD2001]
MKLLSFVIPCYRSEKTIQPVIDEIIKTVMEKNEEYDYEIILVNDCSPDSVYDVLCELAAGNNRIKVVNLAKNSGKHAAVLCGYLYAKGSIIVNLDDDYQCPVYELWKFVDRIEAGYDVVIAKYYEKKQSKFKNFGSTVNAKMAEVLLSKPRDLHYENFSVMKKFVAEEMIKYSNPFPYLEGLLLSVTHNIANIEIEERERLDSLKTGFTFKKSLALFLNGMTAFSVKPLRIATIIGMITSGIGLLYAVIIVIRRLIGAISVQGYSSLLAALLIIGGVIMMMLGIIGEYIGRIYICINGLPQYTVRNTINMD